MLQRRLAKFLIKPTCLPLMPPLRPHGPAIMAAGLPLSQTRYGLWPKLRRKAPASRKVLAGRIQEEVKAVATLIKTAAEAASGEADRSQTVILALGELRKEILELTEASQSIATSALEAEGAAREAQKGAEAISSAADGMASAPFGPSAAPSASNAEVAMD